MGSDRDAAVNIRAVVVHHVSFGILIEQVHQHNRHIGIASVLAVCRQGDGDGLSLIVLDGLDTLELAPLRICLISCHRLLRHVERDAVDDRAEHITIHLRRCDGIDGQLLQAGQLVEEEGFIAPFAVEAFQTGWQQQFLDARQVTPTDNVCEHVIGHPCTAPIDKCSIVVGACHREVICIPQIESLQTGK